MNLSKNIKIFLITCIAAITLSLVIYFGISSWNLIQHNKCIGRAEKITFNVAPNENPIENFGIRQKIIKEEIEKCNLKYK